MRLQLEITDHLSAREAPSVQFSNHFMMDLKRLANLMKAA